MTRAQRKEIARRLLEDEDERSIAEAMGVRITDVFRVAAELEDYLEPSTGPTA